MAHLTRRILLKTGLMASAGLMVADGAFDLSPADAAAPVTQEHPVLKGSNEAAADPTSSRERLLLDFGMAFVQSSNQAGPIQISASAEGLASATVVIQSRAAAVRPLAA